METNEVLEREELNSNCGIYFIKNTVNDKVYVGQSSNIKHRMQQHVSSALNITKDNQHSHIYNAMRKYGIDSFQWGILELCDRSELNKKEAEWISELDSSNQSKGYNLITYDERLNAVMSDITKLRISEANKGKPKSPEHIANMYTKWSKDNLPNDEMIAKRVETMRRKLSDPNYVAPQTGQIAWNKGLKTPLETREKQRLAKLGTTQKEETIEKRRQKMQNKVYQFNLNGEFIRTWESPREIELNTNLYLSMGIRGCCNGSKLYYLDSIFRYEKDILDINNPNIPDNELEIIKDKLLTARKSSARGKYNSAPDNSQVINNLHNIFK